MLMLLKVLDIMLHGTNDVKLYGIEEMEALESWEFSNSVDVDGVKGEEVTMISHPGNFSAYQLSQPSNHQ